MIKGGKVLKLLLLGKLPPSYSPGENNCLSLYLGKGNLGATLSSGKVACIMRTVWD